MLSIGISVIRRFRANRLNRKSFATCLLSHYFSFWEWTYLFWRNRGKFCIWRWENRREGFHMGCLNRRNWKSFSLSWHTFNFYKWSWNGYWTIWDRRTRGPEEYFCRLMSYHLSKNEIWRTQGLLSYPRVWSRVKGMEMVSVGWFITQCGKSPHASNSLEPLDRCVFEPFKKYFSEAGLMTSGWWPKQGLEP